MDKNLWLAELWDEWLISPVSNADYEASGLLLGLKNGKTNRLRTARRLTGKIWPLTSYAREFTLGISMLTRPAHKPTVRIKYPREILKIPRTTGLTWSWLKGLWGSTGGIYFPRNGYYLTLIISDVEISEQTRKVLARTNLSWSEHRNEFTLRNHNDITTFLYKIDIASGALKFEDRAIIKSARNRANVASNYDTANIRRSIKASREQIELSQQIISSGRLKDLPLNLQEIIILRMKYPDYTLEELGEKLERPVKKSAVKYRWDKIRAIINCG